MAVRNLKPLASRLLAASRRNAGQVRQRPVSAAERARLAAVWRPNISAKDLELVEAMAAEGLLPEVQAGHVAALVPQRAAIGALDEYLGSKAFAAARVQHKRTARPRKLARELEDVKAAAQAELADVVRRVMQLEIARREKQLERLAKRQVQSAKPRSNPGVTGLALALPNPAGAGARPPRPNRSKGMALSPKQKRALAHGRAVRAAKLAAARQNISPGRAMKLIKAGAAVPATKVNLKAIQPHARAKRVVSTRAYKIGDKSGTYQYRNKAAKFDAAAADPKSWIFRLEPDEIKVVGGVAGKAADAAWLRRKLTAIEERLAAKPSVGVSKAEMTADEARAAVAAAEVRLKEVKPGFQFSKSAREAMVRRLVGARKTRKGGVRSAIVRARLDSEIELLREMVGRAERGETIPGRYTAEHAEARAKRASTPRAAGVARANPRHNPLDLKRVGADLQLAVNKRPLAFGLSAAGGAVGFLVLSSAVKKWAPTMADKSIRWGVGLAGSAGFLLGWPGFNRVGDRSIQVGLGVGFLVATLFRDAVLKGVNKLLGKLDMEPLAGVGGVYDSVFDNLDGMGRYVATEGLGRYTGVGAEVRAAAAGTGDYLIDSSHDTDLQGLGVDVRAAVAGDGVGRYVEQQDNGVLPNDAFDDEVASAEDLGPEDLAMEGLGAIDPGRVKVILATGSKAQELQGRYKVQLIRESQVQPGVWIVALDRAQLQGLGVTSTAIQRAPSTLPVATPTGRQIVPRGVFAESVWGARNVPAAPVMY